jgi:hypothetical protein
MSVRSEILKRSKKLFTIAAVLYCSGATAAEPLTDQDRGYVVAVVATLVVPAKCPGFEMVSGALEKYGDQIDVDGSILVAIVNAMQLSAGQTYNSAMLIPEVTRVMNEALDALHDAITENQTIECKRWGDFLIDRGLIKPK